MKIIYVCSEDVTYRNYVEKRIREVMPSAEIITCPDQNSLFCGIREFHELYIICDTFFLGLTLTDKMHYIKWFLNSSAKIMITSWHSVDFFFGLRIKNLGFDGYINEIGNDENLKKGITEFLNKGTYFDEEIRMEYLNKEINRYTKYITDIQSDEIDAVLKVRKYGYTKSSKNDKYDSNTYNKVSNFKKKTGVETDEELDEIIHQIKKGGIL